ncbi:MAG: DUF5110 domain-containing protein, partial [Salinivirgaceae bacterium]|nr:DUF5110 domain-containing protein [Salinivirgaceae bacterium]
PNDPKTLRLADEFMFGKSILAAPVVSPQYTEEKIIKIDEMTGWNKQETGNVKSYPSVDFSTKKTAEKYLPKGDNWYYFWDNKLYTGGKTVTVETSIDHTPIFVKAGSIIPFAQTAQNTVEQRFDTLTIKIYPGKDCTFELYEDEGDNYNYERGEFSIIKFAWSNKSNTLTINTREGSFKGMLQNRLFKIVRADNGKNADIQYNGEEISIKI